MRKKRRRKTIKVTAAICSGVVLALTCICSASDYPPAAGQVGSTAIYLDDPNFIAWADGWEDYVVGAQCDLVWQDPNKALGQALGDSFDIVSLGRGGRITMTFAAGIGDGEGDDFAVFENAITDGFLELGFVEVSSDGIHFFRFENDSQTAGAVGSFGIIDPTDITGLASKYRQGYGTPFDLADLRDQSPLLDVNHVEWVRLVDIVGDGGSTDTSGDVIYDPYPTVGSAGFDLDAVGVMNLRTADFNLSGEVTLPDLLILVAAWLSQVGDARWDARCDIAYPKDGIINMLDFVVFGRQWLAGL